MFVHLGNAFLLCFGLDALVSAVDDVQSRVDLSFLRNVVAVTTLAFAGIAYLATALSRRLPAAIFLPLVVALLWLNLGAAPLVLWSGIEGLSLASSLVQLGLAVVALAAVHRHTGGRSWLLEPAAGPPVASDFSAGRFAALTLGGLLIGPPLLAGYGLFALSTFAQAATAGFLSFDLEGIQLAERVYQREGRTVRLVGMMHIGEESQYERLYDSFAVPGTVVLEEGVSDETGLLAKLPSYEKLAGELGLSQQARISAYFEERGAEWPHVRHADIDAAELSPQTIGLLERLGAVWGADDPEAVALQPEELEAAIADVIDLRNRHLLAQIEEALGSYPSVVVPWGALHMVWIEKRLLESGFRQVEEKGHLLVRWQELGREVAPTR